MEVSWVFVFLLMFWCWARSLCKIMHWNKIFYLDYWCWCCSDQIIIIIASRCFGPVRKTLAHGLALEKLLWLVSLNRMQSRTRWLLHRLARSTGLERQRERGRSDVRYKGNGWKMQSSFLNKSRVRRFEVPFGLRRIALWITILALWLLSRSNRVRQLQVNMLDKYWVKLIVNNNVFLVLLHIVLWDQNNVVETFDQYCYLKVCVWCWLYMDRELFHVTDMPFILVLRPLVLWCYSLFFQVVQSHEMRTNAARSAYKILPWSKTFSLGLSYWCLLIMKNGALVWRLFVGKKWFNAFRFTSTKNVVLVQVSGLMLINIIKSFFYTRCPSTNLFLQDVCIRHYGTTLFLCMLGYQGKALWLHLFKWYWIMIGNWRQTSVISFSSTRLMCLVSLHQEYEGMR